MCVTVGVLVVYEATAQVVRCVWSYLSAVPGPSHHNDEFPIELDHLLEPPVGRRVELQQQTVPTTGHGHVRRSQHGFGDDRRAGNGLLNGRYDTGNR